MHFGSTNSQDQTLPGKRTESASKKEVIRREDRSRERLGRSLEIFLLGPALIYGGLGKKVPAGMDKMMILVGMGTILINLAEYIEDIKR